ncbi:MAG: PKD domain-containing protein [Nanoarchaeota archaeon]
MRIKIKKMAFLLLIVLYLMFLLPFMSGSFLYKNNSLQTKYVGGEAVKGNIELRFLDESAQSSITSNFEGSIQLIDLLKSNDFLENRDYNCSVKNCAIGHKIKNSLQSLPISVGENASVGFKITGKNVEVDSVRFSVETTGAASCSRPYIVSVLGNNNNSLQTNKYKNFSCGARMQGCFDSSLNNYDSATITSDAYCEKIKAPVAPAFLVGGKIKNSTQGYGKLKVEMFDNLWNSIGRCDLPRHNASNVESLSCIINYAPVAEKESYVCVSLEGGANANYEINSEQSGNVCGATGIGTEQQNRDYDLFIEALQFDSVGMEINESTYSQLYSESLTLLIDSYISDKYERDCSKGCIIPFELFSGAAQTLNFNSVEIRYRDSGALLKNNQLYLLEKDLPLINSNYLKIDIEKANLIIPTLSKENVLQIFLSGRTILPRTLGINITQGFVFDIQPKYVLPGIDTLFNAITSQNITKSEWDFGDGSREEAQSKNIRHKYLSEGNFDLKVTLTRKDNVKVTRNYTIIAGNSSEAIRIITKNYEERIANLTKQIDKYDSWIGNELRKKVNVSEFNESVNEAKLNAADSDSNKSEIIENLIKIEIPKSLVSDKSGVLPIDIGYESLNPDYIAAVSKKYLTEEEKDKVSKQIIGWIDDNYKADIEFKTISSYTDDVKPLYTLFKIKIVNKKQEENGAYLILDRPRGEIVFKKDYGQVEVESDSSSATAVPFKDSNEIEFLLPEDVSAEELGAYVAPEISKLAIDDKVDVIEPNPRPKTAFYWYIMLVAGFFVVYIILQEWYKKRYESYLFRNKDDLYNIINFIFNQRIISMDDNEIRRKLSGTGWKGEQLTYAFKKIDRKRTGMFEIPIFRFFEQRKIKREIAKRQLASKENAAIKPY